KRGWWSLRALREIRSQERFAVDLALRIDVNEDFRAGKSLLQLFLDGIETVVRFLDGPFGGNPDMELHEPDGSTLARAQIVEAAELVILSCGVEEFLPFPLGPFPVHELVDRLVRCAIGAPQQPDCDSDSEGGVGAMDMQRLVEDQGDDDRSVEEQVRFVVDVVRLDCDRAGARDHDLLVPQEQIRRGDREERYADAKLQRRSLAAVDQTVGSAPADADR